MSVPQPNSGATSDPNASLTVSLEPHLVETLSRLHSKISPELKAVLSPYITPDISQSIPYPVLLSLSRWVRSHGSNHGLDPQDYSMVALLAGAKTSPEKKLPPAIRNERDEVDDEEAAKRRKEDRRAIATLANAALSVGGASFAVWWASERLRWRNEWRVLLALFAAIIIAFSEAILYMIWNSRSSKRKEHAKIKRKRRLERPQPQMTELDVIEAGEQIDVQESVSGDGKQLRHRNIHARDIS